MQSNHDMNEQSRPKLASAVELKGKKAGGKKKSIGKRWAITLVSLVLVLGLAVGAYFTADVLRPEPEPQPTSAPYSYDNLMESYGHKKNDMQSMTVVLGGVPQYTILSNLQTKADIVAAEKEAATPAEAEGERQPSAADAIPDYVVEGADYFTLDNSLVTSMVTYSYSMVSTKCIEEGAEDLAKYGLTNPEVQVHYTFHDGTSMNLNIGDKVPAGEYYYATIGDSNDVYMLYKTVRAYFTRELNSMHTMPQLPVLNADQSGFVYLLAEQKDAEPIEIETRSATDEFSIFSQWLKQPIIYAVNTDRADEVMAAAAQLSITAYAGHAADDTELASFGLAQPFANIVVTDYSGQTISMKVGDLVADAPDFRYAIVDETGDVYTVHTSLLSFLSNCRVSYVIDQFTNLINIKKIDGFTLEGNGKTYTANFEYVPDFNSKGEEITREDFYFEGQYIEEHTFRAFYQVVVGTLFDKRIADPAEYKLDGDVVLRITYDLNYTDEPYVVEYLEYDRDYYATRKEGYTYLLVQKDKIDTILRNAQELVDGIFTYDDHLYDPGKE